MRFELTQTDAQTRARAGCMRLPHGEVKTPVFMPVGTLGTVKGCLPKDLKELGVEILLSNTYHLWLRPGTQRLERLGGLHKFMNWDRPILTDSGGFQVFSLAKLAKIDRAEGVRFQSHLDGAEMRMTPETVMEAQRQIGSDIAMVLDVCPRGGAPLSEAREAVDVTVEWARRAAKVCASKERPHNVFGIVQGGVHAAERERCARELVAMDFDGYAIGGVAVGEAEEEILKQTALTAPLLPEGKPRYAMGIGNPEQLLEMVAQGVDMFDCVIPTREARHGIAYTHAGRINLKNERWKEDGEPLDAAICSAASNFSRAYLRHLIVSEEILGMVLLSLHNIAFFTQLMAAARQALIDGRFSEWKAEWVRGYRV